MQDTPQSNDVIKNEIKSEESMVGYVYISDIIYTQKNKEEKVQQKT